MAGLPARGRDVWVGPPLLANGPSNGLSGSDEVPTKLASDAADRATVSATPAGCPRPATSSVERGERNAAVLSLRRIASALRVPLADLVGGRLPSPRP